MKNDRARGHPLASDESPESKSLRLRKTAGPGRGRGGGRVLAAGGGAHGADPRFSAGSGRGRHLLSQVLPPVGCGAMGQLLSFSVPQFPCM